jgi:hypothetical protein
MLMFQAVNFKQAKATGSDHTVDLSDGGGLYLRIDTSGAKLWVFMGERKANGERVQREAGLGRFRL